MISGGAPAKQHIALPIPRKVIDLSTTVTPDLPLRLWGHKALHDLGFSDCTEFRVIQRDSPLYVSNAYWTLFNHAGTHVDAPNHLRRGAGGIDVTPLESLVGPIRVLDFRSYPHDRPIELEDINGLEIRAGEIVILFGNYTPPAGPDDLPSFVFLSREAAAYLATLPIRAFATDAMSADSFRRMFERAAQGATGCEAIAPVHAEFLARGIPIIESLSNVQELLSEGDALFVGFPLKVHDADGSPIRAAAFVY